MPDKEETDSSDDQTDGDSVSLHRLERAAKRHLKLISRRETTTLKERIAKVPKELERQAEYAKLVEDRLADVEKRLTEVESQKVTGIESAKIIEPAPFNPQATTPEPKESDSQILGINLVTFEQYKPKKSSRLRPGTRGLRTQHRVGPITLPILPQKHIIDVVVPHTSTSAGTQNISDFRPPGLSTSANITPRDAIAETLVAQNKHNVIPERIRINSDLLIMELGDITGQNFTWPSWESRSLWKQQSLIRRSQVILRPFKVLVTYEQKIRDHVRHLKDLGARSSEHNSTPEASNELPQESVTTAEEGTHSDEAFESENPSLYDLASQSAETDTGAGEESQRLERRLQELEALVEVLDNNLKPVFDLRRRIQEGEVRSIAFCDLWHLFPVGGEICVNEGHAQVYRVVDVSGGRPALCHRDEAGMEDPESNVEATDSTTFNISSFCYGFDGKHLGIVQSVFEIKKYDDVKPVTSLPVYPIQYSGVKDGDRKREDFIRRGKKFVALTKDRSSVVHKRYHGLTMDLEELREEVRE